MTTPTTSPRRRQDLPEPRPAVPDDADQVRMSTWPASGGGPVGPAGTVTINHSPFGKKNLKQFPERTVVTLRGTGRDRLIKFG
jgi:hypothetical protein